MYEHGGMKERTAVGYYSGPSEGFNWKCITTVEKWDQRSFDAGLPPNDVLEHVGNVRLIGGASALWQRLITIAASTSSTGAALQAFSTGNAKIGVGTSTVAAAKAQTALQSTNSAKKYKGMSSGWPAHTDHTTSTAAQSCAFKASYTSTEANFAWREWGVANSSAGRHLNRSVGNLGTKTTGTWTLTVTLTETT